MGAGRCARKHRMYPRDFMSYESFSYGSTWTSWMGRFFVEVFIEFKLDYVNILLIFHYSLPLSYLLHTRHTGGFSSYMDAAMMGRSGANCTELYSSCPRLSY
jgi:hypothetical protein